MSGLKYVGIKDVSLKNVVVPISRYASQPLYLSRYPTVNVVNSPCLGVFNMEGWIKFVHSFFAVVLAQNAITYPNDIRPTKTSEALGYLKEGDLGTHTSSSFVIRLDIMRSHAYHQII